MLWVISRINIHTSRCPTLEDSEISSLTCLSPDGAGLVKEDVSVASGSNTKDRSGPLPTSLLAQMGYFQSLLRTKTDNFKAFL